MWEVPETSNDSIFSGVHVQENLCSGVKDHKKISDVSGDQHNNTVIL